MKMAKMSQAFVSVFAIFCLTFTSVVFAQDTTEASADMTSDVQKINLKSLLGQVQKELKGVNSEIDKRETLKRNQDREQRIRDLVAKGNELRDQDKLEEASQAWKEALTLSKDPEMRDYIKYLLGKSLKEIKMSNIKNKISKKNKLSEKESRFLNLYNHTTNDLNKDYMLVSKKHSF